VDVEAIRAVLPERVTMVEDAAHALGSRYANGKRVGTSGNLTCFSFYANKNLSSGEGGAVVLFDPDRADRLRSLRQHGLPVDAWKRFTHSRVILTSPLTELGYKMNYTDLQACIGRVQLKRQPEFHAIRLAIAQCYAESLGTLRPPIRFQANSLHPDHARHLLLVRLPLHEMRLSRDELIVELRARNIGATVHYAPLHTMPMYAARNGQPALLHTEAVCEDILTLPISASMSLSDVEYVVENFMELLEPR